MGLHKHTSYVRGRRTQYIPIPPLRERRTEYIPITLIMFRGPADWFYDRPKNSQKKSQIGSLKKVTLKNQSQKKVKIEVEKKSPRKTKVKKNSNSKVGKKVAKKSIENSKSKTNRHFLTNLVTPTHPFSHPNHISQPP